MTTYRSTIDQYRRLDGLPNVDRRGLIRARREWVGHRVAVLYRQRTGHAYRRNNDQFVYGVLLGATDRGDQIQVRLPDGEVKVIHYTRVHTMWDKGPAPKEATR